MLSQPIGQVQHRYLKSGFAINTWDDLKPYFEELNNRNLSTLDDLKQWLHDRSELESALQENFAWRYIRMSCDNANVKLQEDYSYYVKEIDPFIAPEDNRLNQKLLSCPFHKQLLHSDYHNYLRSVQRRVDIFRESNIPLFAEMTDKQQLFGQISGAQTITYHDQELTLQQASALLKNTDRSIRAEVYAKITQRRLTDRDSLNKLYSELIELRNQIAQNAGFSNYRDYAFVALDRFDYGVEDCLRFHESIRAHVKPLVEQIDRYRKSALGIDELKPWDMAVDPQGRPPLKPFENSRQLIDKTMECLAVIDSQLADCIKLLDQMNRFDLDSRKGKSPGGYNYPLYESGVPFIFMNSTGQLRDLVTMVHESGHAVHAILAHNLPFHEMRNCPSEIAELASMAMELITMEHWEIFIPDKADLKRAKLEHLTGIVDILPWIATVDAFQYWVYENPSHTIAEREAKFTEIYTRYNSAEVNWKNLEVVKSTLWQKQIHLFDAPFYYIEYGIAQLGALAIWKNYREDAAQTIENYKKALSLGYTRSISEVYAAAGVRFDFSTEYIQELIQFLKSEIDQLSN